MARIGVWEGPDHFVTVQKIKEDSGNGNITTGEWFWV